MFNNLITKWLLETAHIQRDSIIFTRCLEVGTLIERELNGFASSGSPRCTDWFCSEQELREDEFVRLFREYVNPEESVRRAALAKLTDEEKRVLGLV